MSDLFAKQIKASKLSFAGLKSTSSGLSHNSDKQNQLSFCNMKEGHSQYVANKLIFISSSASGYPNRNGNNTIIAKKSPGNYQTSSVQSTQRQNNNTKRRSHIDQKLHHWQSQIQLMIEQYNMKFNQIIEALTDMQIRDLMKFNAMIQNTNVYQNVRVQGMMPSLCKAGEEQLRKITEIEIAVTKMIRNESESTQSAKNGSIYSPVSLKGSATNQSIEDTPESLKSRISSLSNKIRANKKVQMFSKINICESIDEPLEMHMIPENLRQIQKKQKKQYRYHDCDEDQ